MSSSSRSHFGLVFLLAALSTIGPFSIDTFLPAMRAIGDSLAATPLQMQQALTVYLFCYALMMLWHGSISDAVGRRPVVLVTTLLFGLASLGCALSDSLAMLLLFRGLQGLCGGAGLVVGRAIIRDRLDGAHAQRLMSQVTMLFSLSPAIAPVVGGWLFGAFGWHSIFVFMALVGFALFALCWFGLEESHAHEARQPLKARHLLANYWQVAKKRDFQLLTAAVSFNFAGFFLYVPSAPVFLMQHLHLGPSQFLWMFGPAVSGIMFGAYLSGRMAGHFSQREIVSRGYWLMFAAAALNLGYNLAASQLALPWAVLPLALYTTGMSLAAPSITINLMDQFPSLRGTVSSLQGFCQTMLSSLVAGAIAPLAWSSSLRLALWMCLLLVLGFACRMGYRLRMRALGR
ncbi:multidrug effflux MFS transporter [Chromobacterium sphagni]|uniref:Bcr/CflA family efflux transporter n=1 Tax=Chromobacterium sphagni TaxID=1903179 RepID=A0A1S1WZD2_9NEIS|nr:multidrug effflux MFS transporter [Chromobacterium sphagni]OHX12632.1 Bcr/CflA family drug resistance efflux transporter [Chromobacterium sphagni]OHX21283.1 Bcr/CflA family drug resistance efflux transporter [Chromobacterium sphagni]